MILGAVVGPAAVEAPLPVSVGSHVIDALGADLGGKHRPEAVPPEAHRFVADVDAAPVEEIRHVRRDSGNFTYIITTGRMISGRS